MNCVKKAASILLMALGGFSFASPALAYPDKAITFIVPFAAGGPSDTITRALAERLRMSVGQTVVVENAPGAGGAIAMTKLMRADPDGYTIGLISNATHAINPAIMGKNLPYNPLSDFTFITGVARWANVLVVNAGSPYKSVGDLLKYAKENPNGATYGSAGVGASNHISGEMLRAASKASLIHVPYKGNAAPMTDLIAGRLSFMFDILVTAKPMIESGRVRALAITGTSRSVYAPDVPTFAEIGMPDVTGEFWFGVAAPAGLPPEIAGKLNAELTKALGSPEMKARLAQLSFDPWPTTVDKLTEEVKVETAKWSKTVKSLGLEIQ